MMARDAVEAKVEKNCRLRGRRIDGLARKRLGHFGRRHADRHGASAFRDSTCMMPDPRAFLPFRSLSRSDRKVRMQAERRRAPHRDRNVVAVVVQHAGLKQARVDMRSFGEVAK